MNTKLTSRELTLIKTTHQLLVTIRTTQKELAEVQAKMASYLDEAINMLDKIQQKHIH